MSGPLRIQAQTASQDSKTSSYRITVRELKPIKEVITPKSVLTMVDLDFNDRPTDSDKHGYSQEDKKFLDIVNIVRHVDGHYEMPLPFREPNVIMPNNKEQAVKRAQWQRRRMLKNEKYHQDYIKFLN